MAQAARSKMAAAVAQVVPAEAEAADDGTTSGKEALEAFDD